MTNVPRRPRWQPSKWAVGIVLLALSMLALSASIMLGGLVIQQTNTVRSSVELTQQAVDSNVRTLSQAQRELLRLQVLLAERPVDLPAVELAEAFVDQRVQEGSLPHQLQALGSAELLARSQSLAARWTSQVRPALTSALTSRDEAGLADGAAAVALLEQDYNQLVSDGEISRKLRAGNANDDTGQLVAQTSTLMTALAVTATMFVIFMTVAGLAIRRSNRQRNMVAAELVALNAELRRHALVVHATDNLVVITDRTGVIEWVNDAFVRTTGYRSDEVKGRHPGALLQGPDTDPAAIETMRSALREGRGFTTEVLNYSAQNEPYWVHVECHPVIEDGGTLAGFVAIETDITDRRRTEESLRSATETAISLAAEKSGFLATMSHEIRTPLNAVLGVMALLDGTCLDDEQREYVSTAMRSGRLLLALVSDILDFSALDSGRIEVEKRAFSVPAMLEDIRSMFAPTAADAGLSLRVEISPHLPPAVEGDEARIRQVIVNLVANSLKFTHRGGVLIAVGASGAPDGELQLSVAVADSGIGIAADRQPRIFLPFTQVDASTTRNYGGTGLGLSICRLIAQHLNGTLDLTSAPGEGSTFTFTVPARRAVEPVRMSAEVVDAVAPAREPSTLRVLLAEDDATNRMVALRMLSRLGVRADVAVDGQEAVDAVRAGGYDLVLMDVHMPRLDGVAAASQIREWAGVDGIRPRIVAVTANALEGDSDRLIAAGMDGYLSKPITLAGLAELLPLVCAGGPMPGARPLPTPARAGR